MPSISTLSAHHDNPRLGKETKKWEIKTKGIIAKESLENLYDLEFKLNKLEFVDQILQLKNTINDEDLELCINHYSVVKLTDYLLRRTRISWFNSNGGFEFISNLKNHFQDENSFNDTIQELKDEGLLD